MQSTYADFNKQDKKIGFHYPVIINDKANVTPSQGASLGIGREAGANYRLDVADNTRIDNLFTPTLTAAVATITTANVQTANTEISNNDYLTAVTTDFNEVNAVSFIGKNGVARLKTSTAEVPNITLYGSDETIEYKLGNDADSKHVFLKGDGSSSMTIDNARINMKSKLEVDNKTTIGLPFSSSREFPPAPLSADITTLENLEYGSGIYEVTASSTRDGYQIYTSFNKITPVTGDDLPSGWAPFTNYENIEGTYIGSNQISGYLGEWIKIKLPNPIICTSFDAVTWRATLFGGGVFIFPGDYRLYGSNDDLSWDLLHETVGETLSSFTYNVVNDPINPKSYRYFAFIVNKLRKAGGLVPSYNLSELRLYGIGADRYIDINLDKINLGLKSTIKVGLGVENPSEKLHVNGNAIISGNVNVNGSLNLGSNFSINDYVCSAPRFYQTWGLPLGKIYCKRLNFIPAAAAFIEYSGTPNTTGYNQFFTATPNATVTNFGEVATVTGDIRTGSGRFAEFFFDSEANQNITHIYRWHDNGGVQGDDLGFLMIKIQIDNYGTLYLNGSRIISAADNSDRIVIVPNSYHLSFEYIVANGPDGGSGLRMYYKCIS